jgi:hypothetical protein
MPIFVQRGLTVFPSTELSQCTWSNICEEKLPDEQMSPNHEAAMPNWAYWGSLHVSCSRMRDKGDFSFHFLYLNRFQNLTVTGSDDEKLYKWQAAYQKGMGLKRTTWRHISPEAIESHRKQCATHTSRLRYVAVQEGGDTLRTGNYTWVNGYRSHLPLATVMLKTADVTTCHANFASKFR